MHRAPRVLFALAVCLSLSIPAGAADISVQTLLDTDILDGNCSLREAIVAANTDGAYRDCAAGSGTDVLHFAVNGTIVLAADLPQITDSLEIQGPGTDQLTIDGHGAFRQLDTIGGSGFTLRVSDLTLLAGDASADGGCLSLAGAGDLVELVRVRFEGCHCDDDGGAILAFAVGQMTVRESTFVDNSANHDGGAIEHYNFGALTIEDSTFSGNQAGLASLNSSGGAVHASFIDLVVRRSTFDANSATGGGGALFASGISTSLVESSTLTGNSAGLGLVTGGGGALYTGSQIALTMRNDVVATNVDAAAAGGITNDLYVTVVGGVPTVLTEGFNLIGDRTGSEAVFPLPPVPGTPNINGDFVGDAAAPLDPLLGPLTAQGGPTWTRQPLAGSPLIDQGSCAGATRDQRGYFRLETGLRLVDQQSVPNFGLGCDIGALELGATNAVGLLLRGDFETGDTAAWSLVSP